MNEHPLYVARCTQIINPGQDDAKYMINLKQYAKYVVALGEKVAPTDIEESMRVGVDRVKYSIMVRLLRCWCGEGEIIGGLLVVYRTPAFLSREPSAFDLFESLYDA